MKLSLILPINLIILSLLFSIKTVQAIEFNEDCHRKNISTLTVEQQAEFVIKCDRVQQLHVFEAMLEATEKKLAEHKRYMDYQWEGTTEELEQEIQKRLKEYEEWQKAEANK